MFCILEAQNSQNEKLSNVFFSIQLHTNFNFIHLRYPESDWWLQ